MLYKNALNGYVIYLNIDIVKVRIDIIHTKPATTNMKL